MAREGTPRRTSVNRNYTVNPLPRELVERATVIRTSIHIGCHAAHLTSIPCPDQQQRARMRREQRPRRATSMQVDDPEVQADDQQVEEFILTRLTMFTLDVGKHTGESFRIRSHCCKSTLNTFCYFWIS